MKEFLTRKPRASVERKILDWELISDCGHGKYHVVALEQRDVIGRDCYGKSPLSLYIIVETEFE